MDKEKNTLPEAAKKVAQNFKIFRMNNKKSLYQVAIEMNLTYSFVHDIENQKKSPSLATIDKIAKYFNVEIYELFL